MLFTTLTRACSVLCCWVKFILKNTYILSRTFTSCTDTILFKTLVMKGHFWDQKSPYLGFLTVGDSLKIFRNTTRGQGDILTTEQTWIWRVFLFFQRDIWSLKYQRSKKMVSYWGIICLKWLNVFWKGHEPSVNDVGRESQNGCHYLYFKRRLKMSHSTALENSETRIVTRAKMI